MEMINTEYATPIGRQNNIRDLLELKVRQHREKPFVIFIDKDDNEEIVTYGQFDEYVNRLGSWLIGQGISWPTTERGALIPFPPSPFRGREGPSLPAGKALRPGPGRLRPFD